ncbi:FHA domain-containing protein [Nocardia macrotermitis]|uniref:FHA domain-containing protein n=1 Tax=Nocardia macrotermitis TaxID=2585198 RepID=A0A7K0D486_9NOCA|nr:FHA domain-containing protein [Nocardia macrotermitis]MQY20132.1 hypothetical protein [Nocardia macrotermitis]
MADVMREPVLCVCEQYWDSAQFAQCPYCGTDLTDLANRGTPPAPGDTDDGTTTGRGHTGPIEPDQPGAGTRVDPDKRTTHIDLVVNGTHHTLAPGDRLLLGRDDDYPVEPAFRAHTNISRRHAIARFDGERLFVTDTDSTNGTFVDDIRIDTHREHEVRPGQRLRLAADVPIEILRRR